MRILHLSSGRKAALFVIAESCAAQTCSDTGTLGELRIPVWIGFGQTLDGIGFPVQVNSSLSCEGDISFGF
jgi:hypothetical protein